MLKVLKVLKVLRVLKVLKGFQVETVFTFSSSGKKKSSKFEKPGWCFHKKKQGGGGGGGGWLGSPICPFPRQLTTRRFAKWSESSIQPYRFGVEPTG